MGMMRNMEDSFRAASDMRLKQFQPVKLTTTKNYIDVCSAATDKVIGLLMDKPNTGEPAEIAIQGRHFAILDGSGTPIAIGDYLGPGADGTKLVRKATNDYNSCAISLDACTISGQVGEVILVPGLVYRTLAG